MAFEKIEVLCIEYSLVALSILLATFRRKLHENEENLTEGGGTRPKFYYIDPPLIRD